MAVADPTKMATLAQTLLNYVQQVEIKPKPGIQVVHQLVVVHHHLEQPLRNHPVRNVD